MSIPEETYAGCAFDRPYPGCTRISIRGELDACSAPQVEEEILATLSPCPITIIDLQDVEFIDSTGIRLLVRVVSRRAGDEEVYVINPRSRGVRRALDIVGLNRVVRTLETLEELERAA